MALRRFAILHLLAALLLISWLFTPTRALWNSLDQVGFQFFNGFVQSSPFWQKFWAQANYKSSEWMMDIVRLIFFGCFLLIGAQHERKVRLAKILTTIIFLVFSILVICKTVFHNLLDIERFGPTACDETAFRLSKVIDWIYVKDHSLSSFPSDHGITACAFIGSMFALFGVRYGLVAIITEGYYCMPRLVTGAHWPSDILVGSTSVALILCAWFYATPLSAFIINLLTFGKKDAPSTV
ncbi:MAG: phosphatase PAP2 family protein [Chlamydiia bacterium]|nr:phosphatase PAP2 family protein [Chlamydiia bacterium]